MKKSVFGRHLKICLLSVPLMALAQPVVAQPVLQKLECLTHGPQLGNVSPTSIRVWARTREPATFRVVYSTAPDLSNALRSAPITTSLEHDATGWAQLSGLRPGTKYYYALELDARRR